jgi:hypothetical protein
MGYPRLEGHGGSAHLHEVAAAHEAAPTALDGLHLPGI